MLTMPGNRRLGRDMIYKREINSEACTGQVVRGFRPNLASGCKGLFETSLWFNDEQ